MPPFAPFPHKIDIPPRPSFVVNPFRRTLTVEDADPETGNVDPSEMEEGEEDARSERSARTRTRTRSCSRRGASILLNNVEEEQKEHVSPLPVLPMVVLCLAVFAEFLSAATASPFLYFMLESFNPTQPPSQTGFQAGVVSSVFFLAQFLTSLLWVSAAERYGRRAVLFASLFGNAITLVAFGMCWDLKSAVMIRFAQGVFNGAVGVARSAVQDLTDETNKASAFTLVGLCWGLGGIVGSIIGGTTEHPTTNFPTIFRYASLFARYPYLLPCLLAASITFTGSILSLFLASNGGPRLPSYPLQTEAERLVGFALDSPLHTPVSERTPLVGKRASTRYASDSLAFRRFESLRSQNASIVTSTRYAPDFENFADLSFGQKLLVANEQQVFTLNDLVRDRSLDFSFDEESLNDSDSDSDASTLAEENEEYPDDSPALFDEGQGRGRRPWSFFPDHDARPHPLARPNRISSQPIPIPDRWGSPSRDSWRDSRRRARRGRGLYSSNSSLRRAYGEPQPFSHPLPSAYDLLNKAVVEHNLGAIPETRPVLVAMEEPSLASQLPLSFMFQWTLVALHSTICDQLFMSLLVTSQPAGGLGMTASDYATLVALMFGFSLVWQFKFYPAFGPPKGPLSDLSMFRLGLVLYTVVYLLFPHLRYLIRVDHQGWAAFGLVLLSAVRYLANCCSYTSIMVLTNDRSPPHLVPIANGAVQCAVSLARFLGPLIGGWAWSYSIAKEPLPQPAIGFVAVAVLCLAGLFHAATLR